MAGVESLTRSESGRAVSAVGAAGMDGEAAEAAATGGACGTPPSGPDGMLVGGRGRWERLKRPRRTSPAAAPDIAPAGLYGRL
jgi:hypothetical protein